MLDTTIQSNINFKNFCARGHNFVIPEFVLNKYPNTLLYTLSTSSFPLDKFDDHMYIDIDPDYIDIVVDYYYFGKDYVDKFYLNNDIFEHHHFLKMDLGYLGIIDNYCMDDIPTMEYPVIYLKDNIQINSNHKYCKIHTRDNYIVTIILNNSWNNSKMKSILFGMYKEYIIKESSDYIDIWIELDKKYINKILSIMRDGIHFYYRTIYTKIHTKREVYDKLKFYLRFYGVIDDNIILQLRNRIERFQRATGDIYITSTRYYAGTKEHYFNENNDIILFTDEERKQQKCVISKKSYTKGKLRYRYETLKYISKEYKIFNDLVKPYFENADNDVIITLDNTLIENLTMCIKNYFCGI